MEPVFSPWWPPVCRVDVSGAQHYINVLLSPLSEANIMDVYTLQLLDKDESV